MTNSCQLLIGGSAPATLGFNAFAPEWIFTGRLTPPRPFRPLSRRSGRIPALPYPPLRYFQSGSTATPPAMLLHPTATTPLTSCLTPGVQFTCTPYAHSMQVGYSHVRIVRLHGAVSVLPSCSNRMASAPGMDRSDGERSGPCASARQARVPVTNAVVSCVD